MKNNYNITLASAVILASSLIFESCSMESQFDNIGEGLVKMNVTVNSKTTRSIIDSDYLDNLNENCKIYIIDSKVDSVLHKWVGVDNLPDKGVYMRYGSYVAEAYAGDSVPASFEHVYFKGSTNFSVGKEVSVTQVNLKCTIANVVASIDQTSASEVPVSDLKVVVSNSAGELSYEAENLFKKGYFMMPKGETSLTYVVSGKDSEGNDFEKMDVIDNVLPSHEYCLKLQYNPDGNTDGGIFVTITVQECEGDPKEIEIYGKPSFSWVGQGNKLDGQLVNTNKTFTSHTFRAAAYGFRSLMLKTNNEALATALGTNEMDLCILSEKALGDLSAKDLNITNSNQGDIKKYFIELGADFLNGLPESEEEYVIDVIATDVRGKSNNAQIRIANTETAITYADPIVVDLDSFEKDLMAVGARSATIPISITDESIENPTIQYRKSGVTQWKSQIINITRSTSHHVVLKNLDPNTDYEYRVVGGKIENNNYEFESSINKFATESEFSIVNGSFEDWTTYTAQTMLGKKTVNLPGSTGDKFTSFWGSGNEGAATANKVLTNKSEDMKHTGSYSARLASDAALGIIAAGNIFVGHYDKTDGTNGVLSLGREYNGSHPTKVRVYANYRPGGDVIISDGNEKNVEITKGGTDQGQIYIALTDEPVEIRTNPANRKLFDANDPHVLAYGQVTWKEAFGPDGQLQMVEIPFEYNSKANSKRPTHLVIVASASKFGDYFCGSKTSVMYLDDFELIYE